MRQIFTILALFLGISALQAQASKDATVPMTATLNTSPTSITLTWANPGNANLLILRRAKGQAGNAWVQVLNVTGSNLTSLTDNGAANGQTYEYVIQRVIGTVNAFGYAHVAVNATAVNSRGKILIFVDSTTADALGVELVRMKNDMRGDGWWPIPFHTGPSSTVASIKNQIIESYNADPTNVKAVLLLGSVPIPYSGDSNWDGHQDHAGAWPADSYYADVNGVWTDASVNDITPSRAANVNIPGDGKFDQSVIPSAVELQVGRVDFRHINAAAFGAADQVALMKRYLDKNHRWRIGDFPVANKALVDDNFGYFGGEAFAANGFRNAYPLVGEANVVESDFFVGTESQSYLLGYGCGGGWYQGASGVGSSADFATDSVNIVFSNLFGSYFGDWDYESDPFMPAALASRGGILTCSWAGRPHWFNQAFTSGETIGYCTKETMNAQYNNGFFGSFGESGAHVALLGDPTLRAHVVKPATNLSLSTPSCNSVALAWSASADAVAGYHIYRGLSQDGPYTRLTTNPVTGTSYTDNAPQLDTLYYQVRAIQNVSTPGGGTYANNAIGPIKSIVFTGSGGPSVNANGGTLNCNTFSVMLTADATPASPTSWNWSGPGGYNSSLQNPSVTNPGVYTVTATDATGCQATATATVVGDYAPPSISATVSNSINCAMTTATINVSQAGLSSCTITGPGGVFVQGFSATVSQGGAYTLTGVSATNGCIGNVVVLVNVDIVIPSIAASNNGPITCADPTADLIANTNAVAATFQWSGPCEANSAAACSGIYTVIVTNTTNGCTNSASTIVEQDLNTPQIVAQGGVLTCNVLEVPLVASTNMPNTSILWTGPCVSGGPAFVATCPGTYTATATNLSNGCTASASVQVLQDILPPIVVFPPVPPLTCANPCFNFTVPNLPGIEIYVAGQLVLPGTPFQICQPGTYPVTIKSTANGCTSDANLLVAQDILPPAASAGPDAVLSCSSPTVALSSNGSSTGPIFTYLWTGPGGFMSNMPNPVVGLIGIYTLVVTNTQNGCTASDQVTVTADQSLPIVNATASGQLNCANTNVQLQSGNSDPGATYAWTPATGLSCTNCPNPTASAPGVYTVVVSVGTCSATDAVEVTKAPDLVVTSDPVVINCDGVSNHCVNVFGGTPPYAIQWSNGSTTACTTFIGAGTIGVSITDSGGCSFVSSQTVVLPPPIQISALGMPDCDGSFSICAAVTGGVAPYSFQWSNGQTGSCAEYPSGGLVTLTVTDAVGCTLENSIAINIPPVITATFFVTHESGPNAQDGSIDLTVTGGTAPYTYQWSNGATTQDLIGLTGGTYTVVITDVNGCTKQVSIQVNTSVGTEETSVFAQLLLSPNPTEGLAMLQLKLHETAALRVEVRDLAGRLIWQKSILEAQTNTLPIDLSDQPAGIYSLSVLVNDQVFTRKLAVIR